MGVFSTRRTDEPKPWFRRPKWVTDWDAWREAAIEVAALSGETLPWPYEPDPPSAFWQLMNMADEIIEKALLEQTDAPTD